ncbi:hypothetical protein D3C81_559920 [compost metagenome]
MNSPLQTLAMGLFLLAGGAMAHDGHKESGANGAAPAGKPANLSVPPGQPGAATRDSQTYFTDTVLVDQNGKQQRFYSDVLKDRVVLLNVVFTSCGDACPLITRKLKEVRTALGDSAKQIHFISLSIDPIADTPEKLKEFAAKNGADDPNWIFLTGDKASMDLVLARLGQMAPSPEQHSTLIIAGDVANKRWSKVRPDTPPAAIAQRLQLLSLPVAGR